MDTINHFKKMILSFTIAQLWLAFAQLLFIIFTYSKIITSDPFFILAIILSFSLILSSLPCMISIQTNDFNSAICMLNFTGRWLYILAGISTLIVIVLSVMAAMVMLSSSFKSVLNTLIFHSLAVILQVFAGYYCLQLSEKLYFQRELSKKQRTGRNVGPLITNQNHTLMTLPQAETASQAE